MHLCLTLCDGRLARLNSTSSLPSCTQSSTACGLHLPQSCFLCFYILGMSPPCPTYRLPSPFGAPSSISSCSWLLPEQATRGEKARMRATLNCQAGVEQSIATQAHMHTHLTIYQEILLLKLCCMPSHCHSWDDSSELTCCLMVSLWDSSQHGCMWWFRDSFLVTANDPYRGNRIESKVRLNLVLSTA